MANNNSNGGVGFAGLLTILFIALKLTDVIDWSWVWVLSPLWISFVLGIVFVLLVLIFAAWDSRTPRGALRNYERSIRK